MWRLLRSNLASISIPCVTIAMSPYCAVVYSFAGQDIVKQGGTIVLFNTTEIVSDSTIYWTRTTEDVFLGSSGTWLRWNILYKTFLWDRLVREWGPTVVWRPSWHSKVVQALSRGNEVTVGYLFQSEHGMNFYCRTQNSIPTYHWKHYFYPGVTHSKPWLRSHMNASLLKTVEAPRCLPRLPQQLLPIIAVLSHRDEVTVGALFLCEDEEGFYCWPQDFIPTNPWKHYIHSDVSCPKQWLRSKMIIELFEIVDALSSTFTRVCCRDPVQRQGWRERHSAREGG